MSLSTFYTLPKHWVKRPAVYFQCFVVTSQETAFSVLPLSADSVSSFLVFLCGRRRMMLAPCTPPHGGNFPFQASAAWLTMHRRAQHHKDNFSWKWDEQMGSCGGHQVHSNKRYLQFLAKTVKSYCLLSTKQTPKPFSVILNFGNGIRAFTETAVSCAVLVIYINFLADVMRHIVLMWGHSGYRKLCQSEVITCILLCPGGIAKIWLHQPRL